MSRFRSLLTLFRKPGMFFLTLAGKGALKWMPDKAFIRIAYFLCFGHAIDLKNPRTFSEKLQWLKLNNRIPQYSMMVDKYEVKQFIRDMIGAEYIIPTIGIWNKTEDIDFDKLPNQFVLKCTHDSGSVVICKDKSTINFQETAKKLDRHLKTNPYWFGREWPYKNVRPRIIAEKYLEDERHQMTDYKLMCFNGVAKCCFVFSDRYSESGLRLNVYDKEWNLLPVGREYTSINPDIVRPDNYDKMIKLAERIAKGMPFVRVDFYDLAGQLFFGEITFFPNSGLTKFYPQEWDGIFGSWITLP